MAIKPILKSEGYKKHQNYWYRTVDEYLYCINVQGSSWNKDAYYINIGVAQNDATCPTPSLLKWIWQHRLHDCNNSVEEFRQCKEELFTDFSSEPQLASFLEKHHAARVVGQYWL